MHIGTGYSGVSEDDRSRGMAIADRYMRARVGGCVALNSLEFCYDANSNCLVEGAAS